MVSEHRRKQKNRPKSPPLTFKGKEIDYVSVKLKKGDEVNSESYIMRDGKKIRITESKIKKMMDQWDKEDERRNKHV